MMPAMLLSSLPPSLLAIGSVVAVSLVSLVGVMFAALCEGAIKKWLFFLISFAVGGLIGDVFIHILPEMAEDDAAFFPTASLIVVAGILLSFLLEKVIHWRHCHSVDCATHVKPLGTLSLVGDAVHNIVDGLLIASSYLVDVRAGIATTIAVVLHEIPQEFGDYAILIHSGYSKGRAVFLNFLTALTAVAGALFVLVARTSLPDLERYLFPLVAGNFLYIAVADLLPELHKQTRVGNSLLQMFGVLLGIALMYALTLFE